MYWPEVDGKNLFETFRWCGSQLGSIGCLRIKRICIVSPTTASDWLAAELGWTTGVIQDEMAIHRILRTPTASGFLHLMA